MRVAAGRSVVGNSDVLVAQEYGNPQEGLQFVSPWWVGIRTQPYLHSGGSRVTSDARRGVDLFAIKLVELASVGFRLSIVDCRLCPIMPTEVGTTNGIHNSQSPLSVSSDRLRHLID
jgi:hypothetical protein